MTPFAQSVSLCAPLGTRRQTVPPPASHTRLTVACDSRLREAACVARAEALPSCSCFSSLRFWRLHQPLPLMPSAPHAQLWRCVCVSTGPAGSDRVATRSLRTLALSQRDQTRVDTTPFDVAPHPQFELKTVLDQVRWRRVEQPL